MKLIYKLLLFFGFLNNILINSLNAEMIVSLGNKEAFLKNSTNCFEHAFSEYHRYFPDFCKNSHQNLSLQITPFYRHLKLKTSDSSLKMNIDNIGGFALAQINVKNFWLRGNIIFGNLKEENIITKIEKTKIGIDDVSLKLGYNFCSNDTCVFGVYFLVGGLYKHFKVIDNSSPALTLAVKKEIIRNIEKLETFNKENSAGNLILNIQDTILKTNFEQEFFDNSLLNKEKFKNSELFRLVTAQNITFHQLNFESPNLGSINNKIGFGFAGAIIFYECNFKRLAILFDGQYYYNIFDTIKNAYFYTEAINNENVKRYLNLKFTAGNRINLWGALHYEHYCHNFELGCFLSAGFGNKLKIKNANFTPDQIISLNEAVKVPKIIKFSATPYLGISYNNLLHEYPFTIGLGLGYKHDNIKNSKEVNLQGVVVWASVSISF
jgi:hypothetical protein